MGAASNIKGIAHELIYVKTENEDGDTVYAFLPEDTNNPQFDVLTINTETGEQNWEQLKTTMNSDHINNWIEKYPGSEGSLKVNVEMANKLGFDTSGVSDKELTIDVNNFLDKIIKMDDNTLSQIITLSPPLTIIAASFVVYGLHKRYKKNEISKNEFIKKSAKITGIKAAKIVTLLSLLALPGIGQVVAVYLIASLMFSVIGIIEVKKDKLLLPAPAK